MFRSMLACLALGLALIIVSPAGNAGFIYRVPIVSSASATCAKGSAYADGCPGAPVVAGGAQNPSLLNSYSFRAPWNVAGVDYPVGYPSATVLTSWLSIPSNQPGISVNTTTGFIRFDGTFASTPSNNCVLDSIDFTVPGTTGGVATLYGPSLGCANVTITNSKFGCPASSHPITTDYLIQIQTLLPTVKVDNNIFDFTGCTNKSASVGGTWAGGGFSSLVQVNSGTYEFRYNYATYIDGHTLEVTGSQTAINFQYNLLVNIVHDQVNHQNFQQLGAGAVTNDLVSFNTSAQTDSNCTGANGTCAGGEGYQFYLNSGGTQTNPTLANNTMIANCGGGQPGCFSYLIHGSGAYTPTTSASGGTDSANYFDPTAAFGTYYPSSMRVADGWTSSGNTDMNTGATITPP